MDGWNRGTAKEIFQAKAIELDETTLRVHVSEGFVGKGRRSGTYCVKAGGVAEVEV